MDPGGVRPEGGPGFAVVPRKSGNVSPTPAAAVAGRGRIPTGGNTASRPPGRLVAADARPPSAERAGRGGNTPRRRPAGSPPTPAASPAAAPAASAAPPAPGTAPAAPPAPRSGRAAPGRPTSRIASPAP